MSDFCWCEVGPALIGLGICLTTTLAAAALWLKARRNKVVPLNAIYHGWAFVSGASSGVGRKVCCNRYKIKLISDA